MKEKVIFTLSLTCFIGIMWLSSTTKTTNAKSIIIEELTTIPQGSNTMNYIDEGSPATIFIADSMPVLDVSAVEICSLKPVETDVFTFSSAFQYYRQCLGSDSSFHWQGKIYTTLLAEEIIIQVADSVHVKEATNNNQLSETQ